MTKEKHIEVRVICWDNRTYKRFATETEIKEETTKGNARTINGVITFDFSR